MANPTGPGGFQPLRHNTGSPYNGQSTPCFHVSGDGSIIQIGDIVVSDGTAGLVGVNVSGMDVEGILGVKRASASTTGLNIVGVCVGFLANAVLPAQEAIASQNRVVLIETDMSVIYECREDGVTTALVAGDMGLNVAYSTTAGDTVTKRSGMEIISATTAPAVTATLPIQVLGLVKRPGNSFATSPDKARFEVRFNTNFFAQNNLATA